MPCAISGFVGLSDKDLLRRMTQVQTHRGPDSQGFFTDKNIGLGTDRLSIIDLVKGDQPIHNEDETIWITYNGEVYNYVELMGELKALGHRFYTDSDTETVVHSYEEWGEDCLSRLRGMFGFAIWDSRKGKLFAARDRFGKKPFYYTLIDGKLIFSSEMKGLLQYEGVKRDLSKEAMDLFFTYFYIPSPYTIFKGVFKLSPGHYLTYEEGVLKVRKYWDMRFDTTEQSEDVVVDRLYSILAEAVKLRLRSDVPLGSFLSGGIDSGVVTSLMCKNNESGEKVRTVTVGFEEEDEHVRYGRKVSEFLGTNHSEHIVDANVIEVLPKLIWHFDEPFADSSFIPTYYVSKVMREEVKVALTGDGGDEMFMGYPFLRDPSVYGLFTAMPKGARNAALRLILRVPGKTDVKKLASHALEKNYGAQDFFGRYIMRMVIYTPQTLQGLYSDGWKSGGNDTLKFLGSFMEKYKSGDSLNAVNYATFKGYLSEMILTKVDRMSMAVSLECRCPLLDNKLGDYVGTVQSSMKLYGGTTKYIFKKMALDKGLLPKEVVSRRKVGFGPPVAKWFGKEWHDFSSQVVEKASTTGLFDRNCLHNLLTDRHLNSTKIFGLTAFTLWYGQYIENAPERPLPLQRLL